MLAAAPLDLFRINRLLTADTDDAIVVGNLADLGLVEQISGLFFIRC